MAPRWLKLTIIIFGTLALLLVVAGPWALYLVGLSETALLPEPPALTEIKVKDSDEAYEVWRRFKEHGTIRLTRLTPYAVYGQLLLDWQDYTPGGSSIAYYVASRYNSEQTNRYGLRWFISTDALAIWISRHWSIEQLLNAAQIDYVHRTCGPR
jgi:hypothetical protein